MLATHYVTIGRGPASVLRAEASADHGHRATTDRTLRNTEVSGGAVGYRTAACPRHRGGRFRHRESPRRPARGSRRTSVHRASPDDRTARVDAPMACGGRGGWHVSHFPIRTAV